METAAIPQLIEGDSVHAHTFLGKTHPVLNGEEQNRWQRIVVLSMPRANCRSFAEELIVGRRWTEHR